MDGRIEGKGRILSYLFFWVRVARVLLLLQIAYQVRTGPAGEKEF